VVKIERSEILNEILYKARRRMNL